MLYKKLWLNLWVFAVTTFAVVWIEILDSRTLLEGLLSPPSRWCGLKSLTLPESSSVQSVTTFAVVWIEIHPAMRLPLPRYRHHLRGGVD